MTNYLSSVFKVLYQTSPDTRESIDVGPEELAAITAQQCFEDADLNHDGRLSYDEFQRWYSLPSGGGVAAAAASVAAAHQLPATYSAEEICEITQLKRYTLTDIVQVFSAGACCNPTRAPDAPFARGLALTKRVRKPQPPNRTGYWTRPRS